MARDDKKTSPAPKSGAAEKKEVAAKKDEGQPKDKTTPDADRSKVESGEKAASSPSGYSRGEGQKAVSKAYRDNWTRFTRKRKRRSGDWINESKYRCISVNLKQTSRQITKASLRSFRIIGASKKPTNPICLVLVRESGR
jgi:hypothetical protein